RPSPRAQRSSSLERRATYRLRPCVPAEDARARAGLSHRSRTQGPRLLPARPGQSAAQFRELQREVRAARPGLAQLAARLRRARWEPFVDAIRSAGRHTAGIRLDHVMGLFRLFWIPDGMTAAEGAYVKYPAPILLSLLASESRRAKAFVIGEDLGLVEPPVRRHLRKKGSLSYRLVWFEGSDPAR